MRNPTPFLVADRAPVEEEIKEMTGYPDQLKKQKRETEKETVESATSKQPQRKNQ